MRTFLFRTLGMIVALAGSIAMLVLLLIAASSISSYEKPFTNYIPADSTLFVMQNGDDALRERLSHWFPVLKGVPPSFDTIVIVQAENQHIPVLFRERRLVDNAWVVPSGWTSLVHGKYLVVVPEGKEYITQPFEASLTRNPRYRRLGQSNVLQPSVYVVRSALPAHAGVFDRLYVSEAEELLLVFADQQYKIISKIQDTAPVHMQTLPPLLSDEWFAMSASSFSALTERIFQALPEYDALFVRARIQTWVQHTFGSDISAQYDLLPLFGKHGSVQLAQSGTGSVQYLLRGTMRDTSQIAVLDRLHASYQSTLPTVSLLNRTLGEYNLRTVEHDRSVITDTTLSVEGWSVRSTRHRDRDTGLYSARRGNDWMLASDRLLLEQAIVAEIQGVESRALQASDVIARVSLPRVLEFINTHLPLAEDQYFSSLFQLSGSSALLSVNRQRGVQIITVE